MLALVLALHLVESVHCGFYRSPGRGACESGYLHKSGDRAHCRLPWLTCADVLVGTRPDNRVIPGHQGTSMFREGFQEEVAFYREGEQRHKGSLGAIGPEAGRGQERELVLLVEALKAVHEGLGLVSGSSEHKMCLRPG